jgi:hypothetical protein
MNVLEANRAGLCSKNLDKIRWHMKCIFIRSVLQEDQIELQQEIHHKN